MTSERPLGDTDRQEAERTLPTGTAPLPGAAPRAEAASPAEDTRPREVPDEETLRQLAGAVPDPELPVITLHQLGVLRSLSRSADGSRADVALTPTYTGCPAIDTMRDSVVQVLREAGVTEVHVRTVLAPPWTTDDITEAGRQALHAAGIAPPSPAAKRPPDGPVPVELAVRCPQCGSVDTALLSRFSATACRALRRCVSCQEPFEHVKEV